jgi:hypothetical protein
MEIEEIRLPEEPWNLPVIAKKRLQYARSTQRFIRGPIPWVWLCKANQLRGSALGVALALWYLAGLTSSKTMALTNGPLRDLGIDRYAKRRGLAALESAGLVAVERKPGRNPVVTLREAADGEKKPDAHDPTGGPVAISAS